MERSVAIKRLGQLLGKSLGYRVDPKAPTQEERDAARARVMIEREERNKLEEQKKARCRALLEADAEYQRLASSYKAACERVDNLAYTARHYKITVGTTNGMFFSVAAEGDCWREVIEKIEGKRQSA